MDEPAADWDAARIVAHLEALGTAENRAGMARFGINTNRALGVGLPPGGEGVLRAPAYTMVNLDSGASPGALSPAIGGKRSWPCRY